LILPVTPTAAVIRPIRFSTKDTHSRGQLAIDL
jgi:hypothetical protein